MRVPGMTNVSPSFLLKKTKASLASGLNGFPQPSADSSALSNRASSQ